MIAAHPPHMLSLSIVVPCYNEEENLDHLIARASTVALESVGDSYEIILINDGSRDGTWDKMNQMAEQNPHLVAVNLSRNHGHQLALSAGLTLCNGARILILDADLQDPPELLPDMIALMKAEKADIVYGQRLARRGETWAKRASAKAFYRLLHALAEVDIPEDTGDFRLMTRRALDILNKMPERYRYIRGMISWIGLKQVPYRYERHERVAGHTGYSLAKMIKLAMDAIAGFSILPLRLASYMGVLSGLAALGLMLYALYSWLTGTTVAGWTSLVLIVLILGSIQLISLGVFGEYLGRLYMEAKGRPLFIIDEIVKRDRT